MGSSINLTATAITAKLKKAGLHCEAGSFKSGGFAAKQFNIKNRNYKTIGVEKIQIRFFYGYAMQNTNEAIEVAQNVLTDAGLNVEVAHFNADMEQFTYLIVTK